MITTVRNISYWLATVGLSLLLFVACHKSDDPEPAPVNTKILVDSIYINNQYAAYGRTVNGVSPAEKTKIKITLSLEINPDVFAKESMTISGGLDYTYSFIDYRTILCETTTLPDAMKKYTVNISAGKNANGGNVINDYNTAFTTAIDTSDKFPRIPDQELLTKVQQQTFKYFWDYAHPTSGLARERNTSGDIVTSGGSGFGLMALLVGIERGFITRQQGLDRFTKIVNFLKAASTEKFHGAFPHWLNGSTGKAIAFSTKDDGADLVETAFLMQGLLTVREYYKNGTAQQEQELCANITTLWENVEWDWFRREGQDVLYWHWSPKYGWDMNMKIQGWNESLIVYVLAAASPTHTIPLEVYTQGWARNGNMRNGQTYYDVLLPLGSAYGGPMFFAHYSFLGLDPRNLEDQYANYWTQNVNHAKINNRYCIANPRGYNGYGPDFWGLTASDIPNGYSASSPTNDLGTIAPTAALSDMPYTPTESMAALHYFYYKLGNKMWGEYGFRDACNLSQLWFASSFLAIDQGPIVCMIENHRTGLLWDIFMQSAEVKSGLTKLGFTY